MDQSINDGGAAAAFDGVIRSVPPIKLESYTRARFVQECAMTLFCNTNFKEDGSTDVFKAANNALSRANVLADLISRKVGFN